MENKQINIKYYNEDRSISFSQSFNVSETVYEDLYYEMRNYKGGQISADSTLYFLLTACSYLWKAEGYQGKPNFDVDLPDIDNSSSGQLS